MATAKAHVGLHEILMEKLSLSVRERTVHEKAVLRPQGRR
jgi:hypothetical protein